MRLQRLASCLAIAATAALGSTPGHAAGGPVQVDVELVLAVDVSYSMDLEEQRLQRSGYVEALRSKEFLDALKSGLHGKVAIAYIEWAGAADQWVVVPFTVIDGPDAANGLADKLAESQIRRWRRTSIAGAIDKAVSMFDGNGFEGLRRVIDISGDGPNNEGRRVTRSRDDALAKGIVINGLPLLLKRPGYGWGEIDNLDVYYQECVIGGPGSFVLPINDRAQFVQATRTKLVMEIASMPQAPVIGPPEAATAVPTQAPRVNCDIGERLWRERWEN